jgi:hypothetical protein
LLKKNSIATHPDLQFLVVINPSSGPGNSSTPDEAYQTAIRQLNTYPNVQKIGYVRTNYAQRNFSEVLADISTYSGWPSQSADLAVTGIFFDESPHQYAAETVEYLERINAAVINASGIQGDKTVSRIAKFQLWSSLASLANFDGFDSFGWFPFEEPKRGKWGIPVVMALPI